MLRELRERKIEFTNTKAKLKGADSAYTQGQTSYLNADNLLSNDLGKQLQIAGTLAHESYRDGNDWSLNQEQELRNAVKAKWRYQNVLTNGRHGKAYLQGFEGDERFDYLVGEAYQKGYVDEDSVEQYIEDFYRNDGDYESWVYTRNVSVTEYQHSFIVSIPDNQEDFDFSEEARKKDPRIIEIIDENGNKKYGFVFSAGFGGFLLLRNRGNRAESSRKKDIRHYREGTTKGNWLITHPNLNDTQYINRLLQGDNNYANHIIPPEYDFPWPDNWMKYNSNGFINGLYRWAGGQGPILVNDKFEHDGSTYKAPLWNDEIPEGYFEELPSLWDEIVHIFNAEIRSPLRSLWRSITRYTDRWQPWKQGGE